MSSSFVRSSRCAQLTLVVAIPPVSVSVATRHAESDTSSDVCARPATYTAVPPNIVVAIDKNDGHHDRSSPRRVAREGSRASPEEPDSKTASVIRYGRAAADTNRHHWSGASLTHEHESRVDE